MADRAVDKRKGRAVLRGDLHKQHYDVDANQATAPVVRSSSMQAQDCVAVLRQQHCISFDAPSAYLQGIQTASEQVVARAPPGYREVDERGVGRERRDVGGGWGGDAARGGYRRRA